MRLFLAAMPPGHIVDALTRAQRALACAGRGRLPRAERLHLTLCFLGERRAEELPAFGGLLRAAGYGMFGDTVVARIDGGEALPRLARALGETRAYKPHITLARDFRRSRTEEGPIPMPEMEPFAWTIGEVVLIESILGAAPRYIVRESVRLRG